MADIVLDTNVLEEFLAQYFDPETGNRGFGSFVAQGSITRALARRLNRIVADARDDLKSLVVASSFAFVELTRKWDDIVKERYSPGQLEAFLVQPPEWFNVAPVDEDLLPSYVEVPPSVWLQGTDAPVECADALHVATVFSRGTSAMLATTDERLRAIPGLQDRLAL